jgi:hypothetical protein
MLGKSTNTNIKKTFGAKVNHNLLISDQTLLCNMFEDRKTLRLMLKYRYSARDAAKGPLFKTGPQSNGSANI